MSDPNTPQQPADPNQPPVSPPPPPYGQQPTQQQPQQPVPPQQPPQYGQPQQPGQQPPSYGQQAPQQPAQYGQQPPQYGQQPPQYAQQQPPQYAQQQPPQYAQQPPQYGQPQYAAAPQLLSPEADKSAAMWANIGGIIGFLPSLIIWLVLKDRGPRTNVEAKEALNWQITFTILYVALWIVVGILNGIFFAAGIFFLPGILALLPWVLWILNVVFSIIAGVRINDGGSYRYPWNFRFIK